MIQADRAITITIDDDCLQRLIKERLDELVNQDITGVTWSLDQFRRYCCANKAKDWVKAFIFIPFADEIAFETEDGYLNRKAKGTVQLSSQNKRRSGWKKTTTELTGEAT